VEGAVPSVLARRLIYVTGKGGVGRTTVSAALGLAAASRGRRSIVCEVAEQDRLSRAFGRERRVGDEQAELTAGLWGISIDPQAALREWLRGQLGSRTLARVLSDSDAFTYFAAAAPGAREMATLYKAIKLSQLVSADGYDLVILDAPASGHGLGMLTTPRTFGEIVRVGPLRRQTDRLRQLLGDANRTAYLAVALAEEMPVNETLEIERALPGAVGSGLAAIVVNGVYPQRFTEEEAAGALEAAASVAARDEDGTARRALAAVRAEQRWAGGQQAQLRRLRGAAEAPVITLPFLFAREIRARHLEGLAVELVRQLGE
jgi:anion-transporting  ArsA/GET3 family ATPase